jgi:hypothetical protein
VQCGFNLAVEIVFPIEHHPVTVAKVQLLRDVLNGPTVDVKDPIEIAPGGRLIA